MLIFRIHFSAIVLAVLIGMSLVSCKKDAGLNDSNSVTEYESRVLRSLTDEALNELVKNKVDYAMLLSIYGNPTSVISTDGGRIVSFDFSQQYNFLKGRAGRVGFVGKLQNDNLIEWSEIVTSQANENDAEILAHRELTKENENRILQSLSEEALNELVKTQANKTKLILLYGEPDQLVTKGEITYLFFDLSVKHLFLQDRPGIIGFTAVLKNDMLVEWKAFQMGH